jgi:hypothetical protein
MDAAGWLAAFLADALSSQGIRRPTLFVASRV